MPRVWRFGSQLVSGSGGHAVIQRAGIPWGQVADHFPHKLLLFLNAQRLELGKQLCRGRTRAVNLRDSVEFVRR